MIITPIKTQRVTASDNDILAILDKYILSLKENTVVAVTSKIVAIAEGRIVSAEGVDKNTLIEQESEYYLPPEENKYNVSLAIKNNALVANAGIDESNVDGDFVLWPKDPQESANKIREHLVKKFDLENIGVIITDSKTTPLRWGVTAFAIAHSGFAALKDYIGTPDLFGRDFKFEMLNIADSLASAASVVMGEGSESMPLAIIAGVPFVEFQDRNPTKEEIDSLRIGMEEDLYGSLLTSVEWKKGRSGK